MTNSKDHYQSVADTMVALVVDKQAAYGDSFGKAGRVLKEMYPDGIPVECYDDALTVVRVIDKLFRVATSKHAFGESPWRDILGYALLACVRDETPREDPRKEEYTPGVYTEVSAGCTAHHSGFVNATEPNPDLHAMCREELKAYAKEQGLFDFGFRVHVDMTDHQVKMSVKESMVRKSNFTKNHPGGRGR